MKTDDDIFVNVAALSGHLAAPATYSLGRRTILGCVKNGPRGAPQPLSASGVHFRPAHPLFTAGAGYVISGQLVQPLYLASLTTRIIRWAGSRGGGGVVLQGEYFFLSGFF